MCDFITWNWNLLHENEICNTPKTKRSRCRRRSRRRCRSSSWSCNAREREKSCARIITTKTTAAATSTSAALPALRFSSARCLCPSTRATPLPPRAIQLPRATAAAAQPASAEAVAAAAEFSALSSAILSRFCRPWKQLLECTLLLYQLYTENNRIIIIS